MIIIPEHSSRGLFNPLGIAWGVASGIRSVTTNFRLILTMAAQDLKYRYAGQFTGNFWIVGHPLLQLLTFLFIFGVVFKQRIEGSYDLPRDYTTYMLSGLVPWLSLSPFLMTSCSSVTTNAKLVNQFSFKTELLPIKDVLISTIFWGVGFVILAVYGLINEHSLPATYLLVPVVLCMHLMFAAGIGWVLASVSVFIRDLKELVSVFLMVGMYVLPIVYLPQWVPRIFQPIIMVNPFSPMIWVYQDTFYYGRIEHPVAWLIFGVLAVLSFGFGYRIFSLLKPFFGRVL